MLLSVIGFPLTTSLRFFLGFEACSIFCLIGCCFISKKALTLSQLCETVFDSCDSCASSLHCWSAELVVAVNGTAGTIWSDFTADGSKGWIPDYLKDAIKFAGDRALLYALQANSATLYLVIVVAGFCLIYLWHSAL